MEEECLEKYKSNQMVRDMLELGGSMHQQYALAD